MMKTMEDMQKLTQGNMELFMSSFGEFGKSWQSLVADMGDYTKRSFDEGSAALEKMMSVKSIEQAAEIQADFAKRAYDDYMAQVNKVSAFYADRAKDAFKPFESMAGQAR